MKLILLSGGSGKRLWPLSNEVRSKQFLKVLKGADGRLESMLQRVCRQLQSVQLWDGSLITTSRSQAELIQSQLDGAPIPLLLEPERRDTFPAIALACSYLYSKAGTDPNEIVCVLPVDPYVEESFFEKLKEMEAVLSRSGANLALMGVAPAFPATEYGYIIPEQPKPEEAEAASYFTVNKFVEKPNKERAISLIEQDALWNCGIFAFKLDYLISILREKGLPEEYDTLVRQYGQLPKISFDYEVVEKAKKIVVLPYHGMWRDLGTWNTLTGYMGTNLLGEGIISEDSVNTHLINELNIPVTIVGLPNIVAITSPDGILIADKTESSRIKDIKKDEHRKPMFLERLWGWYKVMEHSAGEDGNELLITRFGVYKGKLLQFEAHSQRLKKWIVVSGEGELIRDGASHRVQSGDAVSIQPGVLHGLRTDTGLEFIEIIMGHMLESEIGGQL